MNDAKQDAPLYEALEALSSRDTARFHMPGHKGKPIFSAYADIFPLDFTETYGTGNLYSGAGPIRRAERLAAAYYGAHDCHFLTGGATQGVQAMLGTVCGEGGAVLLDRTAHQSAVSACALFGLTPSFLYPPIAEPFGFSGQIDPEAAAHALDAHPAAKALLVVSPNYYGVLQDIHALAAVCHARGKKLLVDAAHGAHLPALGVPSPLHQGADAAVLSAHKTLPALGQGALLLFAESVDAVRLRETAAMVGTSSPSYPVMASVDLARAWLEGSGRTLYRTAAAGVQRLRRLVNERTPFRAVTEQDFPLLDPCRLTVCCAESGWTGRALADLLFCRHNIACEMSDNRNVVFIITGADSARSLFWLGRALLRVSRTLPQTPAHRTVPQPPLPPAELVRSVREASFLSFEKIEIGASNGRVCARAVTPYPPGVPVLWPGEKISAAHIEFLTQRWYTDMVKIDVICENT